MLFCFKHWLQPLSARVKDACVSAEHSHLYANRLPMPIPSFLRLLLFRLVWWTGRTVRSEINRLALRILRRPPGVWSGSPERSQKPLPPLGNLSEMPDRNAAGGQKRGPRPPRPTSSLLAPDASGTALHLSPCVISWRGLLLRPHGRGGPTASIVVGWRGVVGGEDSTGDCGGGRRRKTPARSGSPALCVGGGAPYALANKSIRGNAIQFRFRVGAGIDSCAHSFPPFLPHSGRSQVAAAHLPFAIDRCCCLRLHAPTGVPM